MEVKRIAVHAVYNESGTMVCHAPSCGFRGDLEQASWHIVENQFKVEPPKPRKSSIPHR